MAVASVVAAVMVVQLQDIFRAALVLVVHFLAVAGLFVLLNAEFLAAVQVLIYAGAISILIVFAVLLTREVEGGNPSNRLRLPALVGCGLLLAALGSVLAGAKWQLLPRRLPQAVEEAFVATPERLADLLLQPWVLPFEVASVVLLAAIIGALFLVRER
ncbi:MAG: NADH-quinone oxidoreductase subunit J [Chloroflexi bacterium]|nr:NADH-quinone oxidoreductase subunit J [Chloroflexota bacterium]